MEITRTITMNGRTGQFDVPSFILTENDSLKIRFEFQREIRVGIYRVMVRHGNAPKQVFTLSADKSLTLSADWLKSGGTEDVEFALTFYNLSGTQVIKDDYAIELLAVGNTEGNFSFTAELQRLERELSEIRILLTEEIAVKEDILKKLKDFTDNGVDVVFDGTIENVSSGEVEEEEMESDYPNTENEIQGE